VLLQLKIRNPNQTIASTSPSAPVAMQSPCQSRRSGFGSWHQWAMKTAATALAVTRARSKGQQGPIEATRDPGNIHTRVVSPSKIALTEFTLDCIRLAFDLQGHLTFAQPLDCTLHPVRDACCTYVSTSHIRLTSLTSRVASGYGDGTPGMLAGRRYGLYSCFSAPAGGAKERAQQPQNPRFLAKSGGGLDLISRA
jgi:hypothetical protein